MSEAAARCPHCKSTNVSEYGQSQLPPNSREGYRWSFCKSCKRQFSLHDEKRAIFLDLWGIARNNPNYDRQAWNRIQYLFGLMAGEFPNNLGEQLPGEDEIT